MILDATTGKAFRNLSEVKAWTAFIQDRKTWSPLVTVGIMEAEEGPCFDDEVRSVQPYDVPRYV